MRFGHAADLHLGRIFHGVQLIHNQIPLLTQIRESLLASQVKLLLLTGDIYDRAVPPREAVDALNAFLAQLVLEDGVRVVMLSGNHDGEERLGFCSDLLEKQGLHIVTTLDKAFEPVEIEMDGIAAQIFAVPYVEPAIARDFFKDESIRDHESAMKSVVARISEVRDESKLCVFAGHAFVSGGTVSESERPLTIGGAGNVPADLFEIFDYVALGHLHGPQFITGRRGRYPGSVGKYSFSEANHEKGFDVVTLTRDGFEVDVMPLTPPQDLRIVEGVFDEVLELAKSDSRQDDYLLVRLMDEAPILDAIGRLRDVYPNVMHIEWPNRNRGRVSSGGRRDVKKLDDLELFASFYKEVNGEDLPEKLRDAYVEVRSSENLAKEGV